MNQNPNPRVESAFANLSAYAIVFRKKEVRQILQQLFDAGVEAGIEAERQRAAVAFAKTGGPVKTSEPRSIFDVMTVDSRGYLTARKTGGPVRRPDLTSRFNALIMEEDPVYQQVGPVPNSAEASWSAEDSESTPAATVTGFPWDSLVIHETDEISEEVSRLLGGRFKDIEDIYRSSFNHLGSVTCAGKDRIHIHLTASRQTIDVVRQGESFLIQGPVGAGRGRVAEHIAKLTGLRIHDGEWLSDAMPPAGVIALQPPKNIHGEFDCPFNDQAAV